MRMFVAVRPPEPVLDSLEAFVEPRREVDSALRWTRPESWHITLSFMAAVADRDLDALIERLSEAAGATRGFELGLTGAGSFPNPDKAKLLWTGVSGQVDELTRLAGHIRSACTRSGVEIAGGEYRPHLTLARIRRPVNVTRWLRTFELYQSEPWPVDAVVLYESQLGGGPHQYRAVEEFRLARA